MAIYLLEQGHRPSECPAAFAAWKGLDSPLRDKPALCSCATGGHHMWFVVDAADPELALRKPPRFVAERTVAIQVAEVSIP